MTSLRLFRGGAALALASTLASHSAAAQASTVPADSVVRTVDRDISTLEKQLVGIAEEMPAERYAFSPEALNIPGSALKGVRDFAAQVRHVAADNFGIWAPVTGKPEPAGVNSPNGPENLKSKAELVKFLKDSFAYAHNAVRGLTATNLMGTVDFRGGKTTRLSLVILAMAHGNDHYGQMVEYLRMNGGVPGGGSMKMP